MNTEATFDGWLDLDSEIDWSTAGLADCVPIRNLGQTSNRQTWLVKVAGRTVGWLSQATETARWKAISGFGKTGSYLGTFDRRADALSAVIMLS